MPALAALVAAYAVLIVSGQAFANGDSVEIFRGREGAYELVVGVQPETPTVGSIHLTVTPLKAETSQPVLDAVIRITVHNPEGEPAIEVRALNAPAEPRHYDANVTVGSAGEWTLKLTVRSDALGEASFTVPLQVAEPLVEPNMAGVIVWLAILAALSAGTAYVLLSIRSHRRARQ